MSGRRGVVVAVLITSACASAGADGIARSDLGSIVLSAADAPAGTIYLARASGPSDLESFARDRDELERLRDEGFVVGHSSLFVPEGAGSQPGPLRPGRVLVQQVAGLFRRSVGANTAMLRFVDDVKIRQIPEANDFRVDGLGDLAFELSGPTPEGDPLQMFVWRERNLILVVSVVGDMATADVRALVERLQARAEAV